MRHRTIAELKQWDDFCRLQEIMPMVILEEGLVFLDKIDNVKKIQPYEHAKTVTDGLHIVSLTYIEDNK